MNTTAPKIAILLIAFNRLDLLERRINELHDERIRHFPFFVAIDGPRVHKSNDLKENLLIIKRVKQERYLSPQLIQRNRNYGCDLHIPMAIEEVLEKNDGVIVIEDDVQMLPDAILQIAFE